MHRKYTSLMILLKVLLCFGSVLAEELASTSSTSISKENYATNNNNLQDRLLAYYQTVQSLPFNRANVDFATQAGYNYKTPSSVTYSSVNQQSQTSPEFIDLNTQNKDKFHTPVATENAVRYRSLSSQPDFFVPHIQYAKMDSNTEAFSLPKNSNLAPQESQQNWRPLPSKNNFYSSNSSPFTATTNSDNPQYKQVLNARVANYLPRPNHEVPINCEKSSSNFKSYGADMSSLLPLQGQGPQNDAALTFQSISPSFQHRTEQMNNAPSSNSLSTLNFRRLKVIKSLLAEYIALTQSSIAQQRTQTSLNDNANGGNIDGSRTSADAPISQFPNYSQIGLPSPAGAGEFSDAHDLQAQPTTMSASIRQPHAVYGAPIFNNLGPVEK